MSRTPPAVDFQQIAPTAWADWSTGTSVSNGAYVDTSSTYNAQSHCLALPYNASADAIGNITGLTPFALGDLRTLLVPLFKAPGTGKAPVTLYITNAAFTDWVGWDIVVSDIGWAIYALHPHNMRTGGAPVDSTSITRIRLRQDPDAQVFGYALEDGGEIRVGNISYNYRGRPSIFVCSDDGYDDNFSAPVSGKTFASVLGSYGYAGCAYIIPEKIGESGYETWSGIRSLRDSGWQIGAHNVISDGANSGLRLLGPYGVSQSYPGATSDDSAIYAHVESTIDAMLAEGVSLDDCTHYALPQGSYDPYVASALERSRVRSIRGICAPTEHYMRIPAGFHGGTAWGAASNGRGYPSTWLTFPGSMGIEAATVQQLVDYVDALIRYGGSGACHVHGLSGGADALLEGLLSHIKFREDQGLIDYRLPKNWTEQKLGLTRAGYG